MYSLVWLQVVAEVLMEVVALPYKKEKKDSPNK